MKYKNTFLVLLISITVYLLLPVFAYAGPLSDGDVVQQAEVVSVSGQTDNEKQSNHAAADADQTSFHASVVAYQINRGDTLYKIAKAFGSSVQEITAANGLANPNLLQIGQKIRIPVEQGSIQLPVSAKGDLPLIKKVLTTTLTAYTPGFESTGKTPDHPEYGITYSGVKAVEGRTIAVDPSTIPLGSTVYIDGVGIRTAEDTGGAIRGSRIDVFINNLEQARNFGVKRNVKVFVL